MLVFAYRDAAHFDYAHLSIDRATAQPNHNGIFHVYGGEEFESALKREQPHLRQPSDGYHVVLTYDGEAGTVQVMVDGQFVPALHAVDLSLQTGRIGVGSFDETGDFKNIKIDGMSSDRKK